MATYNWALIERLLHEVQNGAGKPFAPRVYAEQYAVDLKNQDQPVGDVDELKVLACNYEALLLKQGFIEPRPENEGGTGENFVLTKRGSQLLSLIDSAIPGNAHPLQVLNEQADPLDPATFDALAAKVQIA